MFPIAKCAFKCLVVIGLILGSFDARGADQSKIEQVITALERLCLSGKQYQFAADVNGNVIIKSTEPSSQRRVDVNIKETSGGVGYLNEEVRLLFDSETRACMQPYLDRIVRLILELPPVAGPSIYRVLGWVPPGATIAEAQLFLKERNAVWKTGSNGAYVVQYSTYVGSHSLSTSIYFSQSSGKAYYGRSSREAARDEQESYRSNPRSSSYGNIAPENLCNQALEEILTNLVAENGLPAQPLVKSSKNYDPAWNITRGQADFCGRRSSDCSSRATIIQREAKFIVGNNDIFVRSKLTVGDIYVDPNYSHGTNPWYSTRTYRCTLTVEGKML